MQLAAFFLFLTTATGSAQQPSPCSAPQLRQFDFWVGEWEISDARGQRLGSNRIERILNGCVLYESWTGANGSRGHSFNAWDPSDNKWHQSCVDNAGTILNISGGIINGEMVMEGERRLSDIDAWMTLGSVQPGRFWQLVAWLMRIANYCLAE